MSGNAEDIKKEDGGPKLSKNELKRRRKAEEAAKKKAAKAAERAAKAAAAEAGAGKRQLAADEDDTDPTKYYENRVAKLAAMRGRIEAYPHKFDVQLSVPAFVARYAGVADGESRADEVVSIAGRLTRKQASGGKLIFYDLRGDGAKVQVMSDLRSYEDADAFFDIHDVLRRGDNVGIVGHALRTKRGELSIAPRRMVLLSPCLHMLPKADTLADPEVRFRKRYLDLIVNAGNREVFVKRAQIIREIRRFLDDRDFIEVETPMMNVIAGGATAKPFVTYHNDLHQDVYLRIAPELYLKELIVGGLERVYEVGRVFRNESIDLTHHPEFTSVEFYQAFADYNDLVAMTEELVSTVVKNVMGSYRVPCAIVEGREATEIDFSPPWRRVPMMETLEEMLKCTFPRDLYSEDTRQWLIAKLAELGAECTPPLTTARMLDKLVGDYIEPTCINPTFIMDHPQVMSPLAKWHRSKEGVTERFEVFVLGKEICNAYTELNDPHVQRARFEAQAKDKDLGDDEAQLVDEIFCDALEHGLPPTAGWGLGIERLCMMLLEKTNIKDVILFPAMRPEGGAKPTITTATAEE